MKFNKKLVLCALSFFLIASFPYTYPLIKDMTKSNKTKDGEAIAKLKILTLNYRMLNQDGEKDINENKILYASVNHNVKIDDNKAENLFYDSETNSKIIFSNSKYKIKNGKDILFFRDTLGLTYVVTSHDFALFQTERAFILKKN
jgi:hypothetical protein